MSLSCRLISKTISHSGPRPLNSEMSGPKSPTNPFACAIWSGESSSSKRRLASNTRVLIRDAVSRSAREVRVTNLWNLRHGCNLARNTWGICFSCLFNNLRKPATFTSMYCACCAATLKKALHSTADACCSLRAATGSLCMRKARSCRHNRALSSTRFGNTCSSRENCASSSNSPASTRRRCNFSNCDCNCASPWRICERIRAMSSSTRSRNSRSNAVMRASNSASACSSSSTAPCFSMLCVLA
mmetsp:Transcript_23687/g.68078  ORF Transcript_23687/g.68078 Transcript_23687/m.68078 type:complete len:244 (-) Transcript_23687:234-965(-)